MEDLSSGEPIYGIITTTDIRDKIVAINSDPTQTNVGKIMTTPVEFADPDWSLRRCSSIMQESNFHHNPHTFYHGKSTLDYLLSHFNPKEKYCIFLDLNMPIMDGWGFLENFEKRKIDKNIPIYMLTSSIDKFDQVRAQNYELVSKYLVKPLTVEDLATLEV